METKLTTRLSPEQLINLKAQLPKSLLQFSNIVKKRLRDDWDIVIAITGEEGVGKSSLSILLGFLIDRNFDLIKNISYLPSEQEITKKFKSLNRYSVFDVDEAVKAFHKYKWYDTLQQTIIEMYATERFQNKCTLVLMPRFRDFTPNFRNHRIKIWIHVLNRDIKKGQAWAIAYLRDPDKDTEDPWNFKRNIKLKEKKFKFKKITERTVYGILALEKKTVNYFFDFTFPPLPKNIEKVYQDLKVESRKQEAEQENEKIGVREKKWKEALIKVLKAYKAQNPNMSQKELGLTLGLGQQTISDLLRRKKK